MIYCWYLASFRNSVILTSSFAKDMNKKTSIRFYLKYLSASHLVLSLSILKFKILCDSIKHFPSSFFILLDVPHVTYKHGAQDCIASLTREILHIPSLTAHTTLNIYKHMEMSIKTSPQH